MFFEKQTNNLSDKVIGHVKFMLNNTLASVRLSGLFKIHYVFF